jgi:threonine dehydrogenase-like Zn-dependent dehydrogenase
MKAVQYVRSVPRYLLNRFLGKRMPWIHTGPLSLIRLADVPRPNLPGKDWVRIRTLASGICGSDLATVCAKGSAYFSPLISTPFVLGHEAVGKVAEVGGAVTCCQVGERVVIEPALGCLVRGIAEPCGPCRSGQYAHCENVTRGRISAGIQTGYCRDTGGAWAEEFVAHQSQVHQVPDELSDDEATLVEPFSCSLHAALTAKPNDRESVLVFGCGAMGLLVIASLRATGGACRIVAVSKYPHQRKLAEAFGADEVVDARDRLYAQLGARLGTQLLKPEIGGMTGIGGADVAFDCVGSDSSIDDTLRFTRARGRCLLVGMPAIPRRVDWTAIWYKALRVEGVYAYGLEEFNGERLRTFDLAIRLMKDRKVDLRPLVGARYPLAQYREAVRSALLTGQSKAAKTILRISERAGSRELPGKLVAGPGNQVDGPVGVSSPHLDVPANDQDAGIQ